MMVKAHPRSALEALRLAVCWVLGHRWGARSPYPGGRFTIRACRRLCATVFLERVIG